MGPRDWREPVASSRLGRFLERHFRSTGRVVSSRLRMVGPQISRPRFVTAGVRVPRLKLSHAVVFEENDLGR
eukprot:4103144-Amphidinium_carterae.1